MSAASTLPLLVRSPGVFPRHQCALLTTAFLPLASRRTGVLCTWFSPQPCLYVHLPGFASHVISHYTQAKHVEDVRKLAALPADADEDPKVVRIRHSKGESHGMVTRFLKARFRMRKGTDAVTRFADSNAHGLRHNSPRSDTPAVTRLSMDGVEELEDDHTIMDRFMSMRADAVTHAFVGHAAGLPVVSAVWPNARVPYTFSKAVAGPRKDGVGASRRYRLFSKAIQHIQKKTCVTFDCGCLCLRVLGLPSPASRCCLLLVACCCLLLLLL